MKKLLSLLGALGLIATSSATVVSCGDPKSSSDGGDSNSDDATVKTLQEVFPNKNLGSIPVDDTNVTLGSDGEIADAMFSANNINLDSLDGSHYSALQMAIQDFLLSDECKNLNPEYDSKKLDVKQTIDLKLDSDVKLIGKDLTIKAGEIDYITFTLEKSA